MKPGDRLNRMKELTEQNFEANKAKAKPAPKKEPKPKAEKKTKKK